MKNVALYARVSSDLQAKEKTIESQISELKKQIINDGNFLVKEYIDDGYSGAQLDRPAMDQLRKDIKTNIFETIYFLNADRIARDVTYQTIIVSEILKQNKQLIINGRDYIHNPENKFTLTVLGAVSELERAKIVERMVRGRSFKLAQGYHSGGGSNIYGYDYIHKTPHNLSGSLKINEKEAKAVRFIFEEYAKGTYGINKLTRTLEESDYHTKNGSTLWRVSHVKTMLNNNAYAGTQHFNKYKISREYANPMYGITKTIIKVAKRDKSEWVGISVPPIISQELFNKVQERLEWNRKKYRNPRRTQLLSNLIRCGSCGSTYFALKRYSRKGLKNNPNNVYEVISYQCNWRFRARMHSLKNGMARCRNKQVTAHIIEDKVWEMVQTVMVDPNKLREKIGAIQGKKKNSQLRLRRKMIKIENEINVFQQKKKRILDLYTSGNLDKDSYAKKNIELDKEMERLLLERQGISKQIPIIHKDQEVDLAIKQYCQNIRLRYEKCNDFDTKRQFCLDFIDKIIHRSDGFTLYGHVPVGEMADKIKLEFKIEKSITDIDRRRRRLLLHGY